MCNRPGPVMTDLVKSTFSKEVELVVFENVVKTNIRVVNERKKVVLIGGMMICFFIFLSVRESFFEACC